MRNKKKKNSTHGPVSTIIVLAVVIAILSFILKFVGFQASKTIINNGVLEDNIVTVKNIISVSGIKYLIGNVISNFQNFLPLVVVIISLLGIGICEKSGLLNAVFSPIKKVKLNVIIFVTVLIGIISTVIGDYSYLFLLPFVGVAYKYLDKNPIIGIITVYLGITLGYGTGIIFNYNDYLLGDITQLSASFDVDKSYTYSLYSNIYIMIASTVILTYFLTMLIGRFILPKYPKRQIALKEEQELNISKKGVICATISSLLFVLFIIYMIIDIDLPGAGLLLNHDASTYVAKLFGDGSPFKEGIVIILALIMMISGFIYGKISGNIKSSNDYSLSLSKNFENLGFMFVLMFFISQLTAIINWTNIGEVIGAKLVEMVSTLQISGLPLIIVFFFVVIIISIFIPDVITKWQLITPTIVPLFMRANITPNFTLFIYKVADAIGKSITPFFVYFIIMLAFLEKYRVDEKKQVSIFGTLKVMLPIILCVMIFWLLLICLWYLINFPIGVGTYTTI